MKFSYKNIYNSEKHKNFMDSQCYVIDDKFLTETENYELSDGFSVEVKVYEDSKQKENYSVLTYVEKITLKNADRTIYEYYCFDNHNFIFKEIIHHKNGHRYYAFKVDLYGISFLDVDTLEVYNYIPEGYINGNDDRMCGESFIITDVHYDKKSDMIAYGGCYWAGLCEVMVGDFSNPLNFNPHLITVCDILDPEHDLSYDYDFREWKDNKLYVMGDDKEEKSLSIDELKDMINELTDKGEK